MKLETPVGGQGSEGGKQDRLDENGGALQGVHAVLVKAEFGISRRAPVCRSKVIYYYLFIISVTGIVFCLFVCLWMCVFLSQSVCVVFPCFSL